MLVLELLGWVTLVTELSSTPVTPLTVIVGPELVIWTLLTVPVTEAPDF